MNWAPNENRTHSCGFANLKNCVSFVNIVLTMFLRAYEHVPDIDTCVRVFVVKIKGYKVVVLTYVNVRICIYPREIKIPIQPRVCLTDIVILRASQRKDRRPAIKWKWFLKM